MAVRKKSGAAAPRRAKPAPKAEDSAPAKAGDPSQLTEETKLQPGDAVQIEWGGSWWPGSVLALQDDSSVRIHYDGYDSSWDENVPRSRLRLPSAPAAAAGSATPRPATTNPGPVENDPIRAALSGRPVSDRTALKPGDPLRVEWGGTWWAGSVVAVQKNGQVRIHYEGWDNSWDETVPRSRLCLPAAGPLTVSVTFDNGKSLTGLLSGSAGEFLILLREGNGGRALVNKQRILYVEVAENS